MSEWRPEDPSGGYPSYQGSPVGPYQGQPAAPVDPRAAGPWNYPPGYPQGYPGYPPPWGYGVAPVPPGQRRPGTLTASAILGYVLAGLIIFAGVLLFFGASVVHDFQSAFDSSQDFDVEFVLDGIANLIAGGFLIAGSVMMCARNALGRILFCVGNGIVIAMSVYWIARWATHYAAHGLLVYAFLFDALAVVGLSLAFTRDDNRWLAGRAGGDVPVGSAGQGR